LAANVLHHAVRKTFLDGKNNATNSTVFPTSFLSFFLKMKLSVSSTNFTMLHSLDQMECETVMFHDEANRQTHVHCHCVVFVLLSILSIQLAPLAMPRAIKRQMKPQ